MDEGTKRLGTRLQVAREARRPRLTQPAAAELLGVSRTTVQNIEAGQFVTVNHRVREYAKLLGFADGEAERIVAGEPEPTLADLAQVRPESSPLPLPPAVEYELRSSQTLESAVINLGPDEDDGHVIFVLQGRKDATPEEVARIAARYRKVRRYLQNLAADDDEVAES
ncbi:helix-turn-helix transcriptional regulator [Streptomyces sp. YIM S03343]